MVEVIGVVIGIVGLGEVAAVAGETVGRSVAVAIAMATGAFDPGMAARQGECRQVVAERRRRPRDAVVTEGAVVVEVGLLVIGIGCGLKIAGVAGKALIDRAGKLRGMTGDAFEAGMTALELELGRMIISCATPGVGGETVTGFAIEREGCQLMVGIVGRTKIVVVTAGTFGRRAGEIIAQLIDMAGVAVGDRMHARQGEAERGVLVEEFAAIFPTFRRMTALTLVTQLAAMNVAVAVGAAVLGLSEFEILVAGNAGRLLVGADQRKTGVVVIETAVRLHLRPTGGSMTYLARQIDVAMRVARAAQRQGQHQAQSDDRDDEDCQLLHGCVRFSSSSVS